MKKQLAFLLSHFFVFVFLFCGSSPAFSHDFQDGLDAYSRKDYKTAYKLWFSLAEQGDASAQFGLGLMYGEGQGVPQDDKEAVKWYRLSAEQGEALAQYNLGLMYGKGQGVPQDYVSAHMWFNLTGSNGMKTAMEARNLVGESMSPPQLEKAQEMARDWKPSNK